MHPLKPELALPKLRRELEEILALLNGSVNSDSAPRHQRDVDSSSSSQPGREPCSVTSLMPSKPSEVNQSGECDQLFDDALVVITEFGQASPGILQMWLSIDYTRAAQILSQLEEQGLVSPKGKVRHKAFELRRSI